MNNFVVGDLVLYGSNGVCRVDSIDQRETGTYYVLLPVHKDHTRLMVPAANANLVARMKPMPEESYVVDSIRRAHRAETSWIDDGAERKAHAHAVIDGEDAFELLMLVRDFSARRDQVLQRGKKFATSDNGILRNAQKHVRDQFSIVLDIDPEEVDGFIQEQIGAL